MGDGNDWEDYIFTFGEIVCFNQCMKTYDMAPGR